MIAAILVLVLIASGLVYGLSIRHWFVRWGATGPEITRPMRGDAGVMLPTYSATLAIGIDAKPEHIWPWLVQMGYRRGGLYSYDWLDRLFGYLDAPSATRILPLFQHLEVGDEIPMGRGPGFPVRAIEPYRALVLGDENKGFEWVWQFGLYPINEQTTRLVSRNEARLPTTLGAWLFMRVLEPAAFVMTRRMLIGIKARVEGLTTDHASTRAA